MYQMFLPYDANGARFGLFRGGLMSFRLTCNRQCSAMHCAPVHCEEQCTVRSSALRGAVHCEEQCRANFPCRGFSCQAVIKTVEKLRREGGNGIMERSHLMGGVRS